MKLNFRQGLASFQKDTSGNSKFLQPSSTEKFVSLIVSPTPTIITFAHGKSNYLQTFDKTIINAWGPLVPNIDNWLYFDIDLLTANVTFGITTLTPVYSTGTPVAVNDQHWFDQNTTTMKVWSTVANKWQTKLRVFAGVSQNGSNALLDMQPVGSQAYINGSFDSGYILLDTQLRPLRISDGEFLTGDMDIRVKTTASTAGVLASPLNGFIAVQAGENLPVMSAVCFSPEGTVVLANSSLDQQDQLTPVGIVRQALTVNEVGPLTIAGEVIFDQWDWSEVIGKVVYYNATGKLTTTRPDSNLAYRIGVITGKNSILVDIDAETLPHVYTAENEFIVTGDMPISTTEAINEIGSRVITVKIAAATATTPGMMTPELVQKLETSVNDTTSINESIQALYTDKANKVHTHQISEVINLSTELANRALVNHTHSIDTMPSLVAALDTKADLLHKHGISDVIGLQPALNNKANTVHQHSIPDVTGLQAALNDKANLVHTHDEYLPLVGGTLTGPLVLSGLPINGSEATNKNYVDLALADIKVFIGTEIETKTSNLSFPLLAPSSFEVPSYSFIDDVQTGILFSSLNSTKKLSIKMSDNKKGVESNILNIYSGGIESDVADVAKFKAQGAGIALAGSKLKLVGGVTNVEIGEVLISTGSILQSPAALSKTTASILLGKTTIKDGAVEAGNIVIETATPTGIIGGEISLKFGTAKSLILKNTGAMEVHGTSGTPGQVLTSQGPNGQLTWADSTGGIGNLPVVMVEAADGIKQAVADTHYICIKNAPVTIRLPANPSAGTTFYMTIANTLQTNKIELYAVGDVICGINEPCTIDVAYGTVGLKFIPTIGWVLL